ncbi:hypothetical protein ABZZ17_28310 [Streptomyces sp. NPDC006512]|uniref:hypothetical protein n=1 Tax=Streptomyces sp. NPDC006512 TaxID=3154307 RepID=UPI0033B14271
MPYGTTDGGVRRSGRVALVSGTGEFGKGFDRLWHVRDEVRLMRTVLAATADLTIHPASRLNPSVQELKDSLEEALAGPGGVPPDVLVFSYSSHGVLGAETELRLAAADSRHGEWSTMLDAGDLVSLVLRDEAHSPREIVVLLDCCYAGTAVNAFKKVLAQREALGAWIPVLTVIGATERNVTAPQLHFADSFASTLSNPPADQSREFLPTKDLFEELKRRMLRLEQPLTPVNRNPDEGETRAFRNPLYESRTVRRPQEATPQSGWAFCGRAKAAADLVAYLTSQAPPGGLAVTGAEGSGKSVLLDWIHTGARDDPLPAGPGAPAAVPRDCVDLLVDVRGLETRDAARKLAAHYGTGTGSDVPALVDALANREGTTAVLVDSVDACMDPDTLYATLLAPLAALPRVRLVMACKEVPAGFPGRLIALDGPEFTGPGDIAGFVRHVLCHRKGSRWHPTRDERLTEVADTVAKISAGSWLRAYLFSVNLSPLDPAEAHVDAERTIADLFLQELETFDADPRWAQNLLLPVALAQGTGLPADGLLWAAVLRALGGESPGTTEIERVQRKASEFLASPEEKMHGAGWRFPPSPYAAALAGASDAEAGHAAFVRAMYEGLPTRPRGGRDWTAADRYTRSHFAHHARLAGVLDTFLDDPEFLLAMDAETLRRALNLSLLGAHDKASRVHSLCEQLHASPLRDGHTLSRLALLAQVHGLDELARRAGESSSGWVPSLLARKRHPTAVFFARDGRPLVVADGDVLHREVGDRPATSWSRLETDLREERVTTASVISLPQGECVFAGEIDGRAWIQGLDNRDAHIEIAGLDLRCELVACLQAGAGLLVAGTDGWQWRENRVTGPVVPAVGLRLGGAAAAVCEGGTLVAGRTARNVSVWRSDGVALRTFTPPQRKGLTAIAADARHVHTGAGDGTVWSTPWRGGEGHRVTTHKGRVAEVRVGRGRNGPVLVSTGQEGDVRITPLDDTTDAAWGVNLGLATDSADIDARGGLLVGTEAGVVRIDWKNDGATRQTDEENR